MALNLFIFVRLFYFLMAFIHITALRRKKRFEYFKWLCVYETRFIDTVPFRFALLSFELAET